MREWDRDINLIRELAIKDLKIRYSRPFLGFLWAFLSPIFMVAIFYIVFGLFFKVKIEEAPFVLFLMSGIFPWMLFQDSVARSLTSLVDNRNLVREANFPCYLIPIAVIAANLINFLPSLTILIISSLIFLKGAFVHMLLLPAVLLLHLLIITGLSIMCSILYVRWRDIKYLVDILLLALFYFTPIFYSISSVKLTLSPQMFKIYISNPFTAIFSLYRIAFLKDFGLATISDTWFLMPIGFCIVVFLLTNYVYKKNKKALNDYLSY